MCLPEGRGEGGRAANGEDGRVTAGVVTVDEGMERSENILSTEDEEAEDMMTLRAGRLKCLLAFVSRATGGERYAIGCACVGVLDE